MDVAPWLPLIDALLAGADPALRVAQLATVRDDGTPAVRSVVVRGRLADGRLVITTDRRSAKAAQLVARPGGELCWWLPATREQLRLGGTLRVATEATEDRLRAWHALPSASRQMFTWPEPGAPRADDAAFAAPAPAEPPACFALLLMRVETAERLDLRPHPHARTRWRRATGWRAEALDP